MNFILSDSKNIGLLLDTEAVRIDIVFLLHIIYSFWVICLFTGICLSTPVKAQNNNSHLLRVWVHKPIPQQAYNPLTGTHLSDKKFYGLIDATGKEVLPPEYEDIKPTSSKFFILKRDSKYRLFTHKTKTSPVYNQRIKAVTAPTDTFSTLNIEFDFIEEYFPYNGTNSHFLVSKDKKWGMVDDEGNIIVKLELDSIDTFSSVGVNKTTVARAFKDGKCGFINSDGLWMIPPKYDYLSPYEPEGIIASENNLWGIIDMYQKIKLPFKYDSLYWEGRIDKKLYVCCRKLNENSQKKFWGVFEAPNYTTPQLQFAYDKIIKIFSSDAYNLIAQGLPAMMINNQLIFNYHLLPTHNPTHWKYSPSTAFFEAQFLNNSIIQPYSSNTPKNTISNIPLYQTIYRFSNNHYLIQDKNNLQGVLFKNKNDSSVFIPCYYNAIESQGDFYHVEKNGLNGIYNTKGKLIHPLIYNDIYFTDCKDDIILQKDINRHAVGFKNEGIPYLLKTNGEQLPLPDFDMIEPIYDIDINKNQFIALAVRKNNLWAIADTAGNLKSEFKFERIVYAQDNSLLTACNTSEDGTLVVGLTDLNGKEILPCEYLYNLPVLNSPLLKNGIPLFSSKNTPNQRPQGLMGWDGKWVINPEYTQIAALSDSLYLLQNWFLSSKDGDESISQCKTRIASVDGSLLSYDFYKMEDLEYWNTGFFNNQSKKNHFLIFKNYDGYKVVNIPSGVLKNKTTYEQIIPQTWGALVLLQNKWGLIDQLGNEVIPCQNDSIGYWFTYKGLNYYKAKQNKKYGVFDQNGKEVFPSIFHKIEYDSEQNALCIFRILNENYQSSKSYQQFANPNGEVYYSNTPNHNPIIWLNQYFYLENELGTYYISSRFKRKIFECKDIPKFPFQFFYNSKYIPLQSYIQVFGKPNNDRILVKINQVWKVLSYDGRFAPEQFVYIQKQNTDQWAFYKKSLETEIINSDTYFVLESITERWGIQLKLYISVNDSHFQQNYVRIPSESNTDNRYRNFAVFNKYGRKISEGLRLVQVLSSERAIIEKNIPINSNTSPEDSIKYFGVMDSTGKIWIEPTNNNIIAFKHFYWTEVQTSPQNKQAILNEDGREIMSSFTDNLDIDINRNIILKSSREIKTASLRVLYDTKGNYLGTENQNSLWLKDEINNPKSDILVQNNLKPIKKKTGWGISNTKGKELVIAKYDSAWIYDKPINSSISFAYARKDTHFFIISENGHIIPSQKDFEVSDGSYLTSHNLLFLQKKDDIAQRQTLISSDGKIILGNQWEKPILEPLVTPVPKALADYIKITINKKCGIWHKTLKLVVSIKYEALGEPKNDLIPYQFMNRWGILNLKGQEISPPNAERITLFNLGAKAPNYGPPQPIYHLISAGTQKGLLKNGKPFLNCEYDQILPLSSDKWVAVCKHGSNLWFLLSLAHGGIIGSSQGYEEIHNTGVLNGYNPILVVLRKGLYGLIDLTGELLPPTYTSLIPNWNSDSKLTTWRACLNGKWKLLNLQGRALSEGVYDGIE